jgi:hypothetical protein
MSPTARRILAQARARIADPARWTRGAWARDAAGRACYHGPGGRAVAWCVVGAIWHEVLAAHLVDGALNRELMHAAAHDWTEQVNDFRGHAAALAVLDRALEPAGAA